MKLNLCYFKTAYFTSTEVVTSTDTSEWGKKEQFGAVHCYWGMASVMGDTRS